MATDEKTLKVMQAAKRLSVSPRTLRRWAETGAIERNPDGTFNESVIDDALENDLFGNVKEASEEEITRADVISDLRLALKQAQDHNERLLKLLEQPINSAIMMQKTFTDAVNVRLQQSETTHIETMEVLGDVLMRKTEIAAREKEADTKAKTYQAIGANAAKFIPVLLEQVKTTMAGKNKLSEFVAMLNDEEKKGIAQLEHAFDEEPKKRAMIEVLSLLGLPRVAPPTFEEPQESEQSNG